jgi:hypothetical protein
MTPKTATPAPVPMHTIALNTLLPEESTATGAPIGEGANST